MKTRELICIRCPLGCHLTVTLDKEEVISVSGNTCKRGAEYGAKECTHPTRIVTSTMAVENGTSPIVPCKTSADIPKDLIFSCMKEINQKTVTAPVAIGDILIENICNTGVAIVASGEVKSLRDLS